jgi:hypothetical protein
MGNGSCALLLGTGIVTSILFCAALILSRKEKSLSALLQVLGAGCLAIVVLTHVAEAIHLLPWMHWGLPDSIGHYVDLGAAGLGLTLFPLGYLIHALE